MIEFKVHYSIILIMIILFFIGCIVEPILAYGVSPEFEIQRNTNNLIIIREVRNHGLNVSEPITLYKIQGRCSDPAQHGCYRFVRENGETYEYGNYLFEDLLVQRTRLYNLEQIERIRNNNNEQRQHQAR